MCKEKGDKLQNFNILQAKCEENAMQSGVKKEFCRVHVDEQAISAKVEDGILTIDLPKIKREDGKIGRQIAISISR